MRAARDTCRIPEPYQRRWSRICDCVRRNWDIRQYDFFRYGHIKILVEFQTADEITFKSADRITL